MPQLNLWQVHCSCMGRAQNGQPSCSSTLHQVKPIFCIPAEFMRFNQSADPSSYPGMPDCWRFFLHIRDHRTERVGSPMVSCLETLNPTSRTMPADDIFPLIPIFVLRRRQSLAFDGQQCVEVRVTTTFNPNGGGAGSRNQINLAPFVLLIWFFNPELKDVPTSGVPGGAIEMGTELRRQNSLGCLAFPVWPISPLGQLISDEIQEFMA